MKMKEKKLTRNIEASQKLFVCKDGMIIRQCDYVTRTNAIIHISRYM